MGRLPITSFFVFVFYKRVMEQSMGTSMNLHKHARSCTVVVNASTRYFVFDKLVSERKTYLFEDFWCTRPTQNKINK